MSVSPDAPDFDAGLTPGTAIPVENKEQYDHLADGTWVKAPNGTVYIKGRPIPTVRPESGQSDYDKVPMGATYSYLGHWYNKHFTVFSNKGTQDDESKLVEGPEGKPVEREQTSSTRPPDWSWLNAEAPDWAGYAIGYSTAIFIVLFLLHAVIHRFLDRSSPEPSSGPRNIIYTDHQQYQLAAQQWSQKKQTFDHQETDRIAALNEKIKGGGIVSRTSGWVACAAIAYSFYKSGWTGGLSALVTSIFVIGAILTIEEQVLRFAYRKGLRHRPFTEPEPIYEGPTPRWEPPPRQEPPRREEPPPPTGVNADIRVTSMQQAYEILGIPAGRITLQEAKRIYRERISEYHPDKVAHLGKELRDLADRKSLEINLAMKFIEEHVRL
jgi:hypothetical protein